MLNSSSNRKLPAMGYTMAKSTCGSCSLQELENADRESHVVLHSAAKEVNIGVEVVFALLHCLRLWSLRIPHMLS
jgi:hypothetical protein